DAVERRDLVGDEGPPERARVLLRLGRVLRARDRAAPLHITQLRATCAGDLPPCAAPMRRSSATTGSISAIGKAEKLRFPGGGFATPYFPVRRPIASGEYASSVTPRSRHARSRPLVSGIVRSSEYSTWFVARGMPSAASAAWMARISPSE